MLMYTEKNFVVKITISYSSRRTNLYFHENYYNSLLLENDGQML